jgi:hypothetical protein
MTRLLPLNQPYTNRAAKNEKIKSLTDGKEMDIIDCGNNFYAIHIAYFKAGKRLL